jgi:hypothetical protein
LQVTHEESQAAYYSREGLCRMGLEVCWRGDFPESGHVYCLVPTQKKLFVPRKI